MSGKSAPEIEVSSQEISEAFKRSGLPHAKFSGFYEGYRLGRRVKAEGEYLQHEQCPPTEVRL